MKKLIATLTALTMTVILAVSASAATSPDRATVKLNGSAAGYNQSANDYLTYSRTVKSHIEETDDGFRRIEYYDYDGKLIVEDYYSDLTLKFRKIITKTSYVFGGYYQGSDYCYLVWGKNNPEESDDQEVLLIEKWTKGVGTRVSTVSVYGANTYIPFDAGSLRMTETAGKLYIHTSHEMYMSDDGYHHQANMTFVVNTSTMTVVDSWYDVMNIRYGYVSHSFNQFIETDGSYIYRIDHGDAYPRSVVITKCAVGDKITKVSYADALPISGAIGDNFTGVSVGGVELTANNIIIAGNTADQSADYVSYYSKRNIFITVTDKNLSKTTVKYLTNYTDDDEAEVCTPQIVKINDNKFLVMWEELKDYTIYTRLCAIDGQGNLTSDITDTYMYLSDCAPVLFSDGLVYWFKSDTTGATLYRVNPDDIDSANNGQVTKTENFKAAATDTTVTLSWDLNSSATCYNVEKYENGYWYPVVGIAQNSITATKVDNLTPATTYKYRIVPSKLIGDTWVYGEPTELTITTKPSAVTGFTNSAKSYNTLTLSWNKNTSGNGYAIQMLKNGTWTSIKYVSGNATTSYKVTGLNPGTTYSFRICAYNYSNGIYNYGAFSSPMSAITLPSSVTGFANTSKGSNDLTLSWNKNTSGNGYVIQMLKNGTWTSIKYVSGNTVTSYTVTGLNPSTTYSFRICAYNYAYNRYYYGAFSSSMSAITLPTSVTGLSNSAKSTNTLTLSWNRNTSATGYVIQMQKDGVWTSIRYIPDNITTSYKVTGLNPGTAYSFRVCAYNYAYNRYYYGAFTNTLTIATKPSDMQGFAIGGRAADALRLNWTANETADGYIIEQYKDGKWVRIAKITNPATTTYRVTGLAAGTAYKFRMKAYKMDGSTALYSGYTSTLSAHTNPSKVSGLKLGGRAADALRLNWTKNTSADGYIIEQYKDGKWVRIAKITSNATTTYRVTGLKASTQYKFRVKAYKMSGSTALYSGYTSTLSAYTNPSKVANLKITGKASNALRLGWDKNASADGYIIEQYKDGKWVRIKKITTPDTITYRIEGLESGTTYKFRVRTYNMVGSTALYGGYVNVSGTTNK